MNEKIIQLPLVKQLEKWTILNRDMGVSDQLKAYRRRARSDGVKNGAILRVFNL